MVSQHSKPAQPRGDTAELRSEPIDLRTDQRDVIAAQKQHIGGSVTESRARGAQDRGVGRGARVEVGGIGQLERRDRAADDLDCVPEGGDSWADAQRTRKANRPPAAIQEGLKPTCRVGDSRVVRSSLLLGADRREPRTSVGEPSTLLLHQPLRQALQKLGNELACQLVREPACGIELLVSAPDKNLRLLHDR